MQFFKAFAIAALSSPVFTWAVFDVGCLTRNNSPVIEDVTDCINQLYNRGGDCPHGNSACNTLVSHGSATIKLCGAKLQTTDLTCSQVAGYANDIQQMCQINGLAEGTAVVNATQRVVVGHS
ncbi:hypothetical protein PG996_009329 [Apiospora saccharicola]|uniref:Uncharacterized protein n=1 Tax=Apiospora saccharicola TaxID=335842 RepID=A0ABR1UKE9_9PEZI